MKYKLYECHDKYVIIKTVDGQVFQGFAYDYIPPQDNVSKIASISIGDVELYENEIIDIEILE